MVVARPFTKEFKAIPQPQSNSAVTPGARLFNVVRSIISIPNVVINKSAEIVGGKLIYDVAIKRVFGSLGVNKLASSLFMPVYVRLIREPAAKLEERVLGYRTGAITEEGVRSAIIGGVRWAFLLDAFPMLFSGLSRFLGSATPEQVYRTSRSLSMLLGSSDVFKNGILNFKTSLQILAKKKMQFSKLSEKERETLKKTLAMLVSAPLFLWAETVGWPMLTHGNEIAERINAVLFTDIALFAFVGRAQELAHRGEKIGNKPLSEILEESKSFQLLEAVEEGITGAFAAQSAFGLYRLGQMYLSKDALESSIYNRDEGRSPFMPSTEKTFTDFQDTGAPLVHKYGVFNNIDYTVNGDKPIIKVPDINSVVREGEGNHEILPTRNGDDILVDLGKPGHIRLVADSIIEKLYKDSDQHLDKEVVSKLEDFFMNVFRGSGLNSKTIIKIDLVLKQLVERGIFVKGGSKKDIQKEVDMLAPHVQFMIFRFQGDKPKMMFIGNKNGFSGEGFDKGNYYIVPMSKSFVQSLSTAVRDMAETGKTDSIFEKTSSQEILDSYHASQYRDMTVRQQIENKDVFTNGVSRRDLFEYNDDKGDSFKLEERNDKSVVMSVKLAQGQLLLPVIKNGLKALLLEKDPLNARNFIESGQLNLDWLAYMLVANSTGKVHKVSVHGDILHDFREVKNIDEYSKLSWNERFIEFDLTKVMVPKQEVLGSVTGSTGGSVGQILRDIAQSNAGTSGNGKSDVTTNVIPIEKIKDVKLSNENLDVSFAIASNDKLTYASNLERFLATHHESLKLLVELGVTVNKWSGQKGYTLSNLSSDIRNFGLSPDIVEKIKIVSGRNVESVEQLSKELQHDPKIFLSLMNTLYTRGFFKDLTMNSELSGILALRGVKSIKALQIRDIKYFAVQTYNNILFIPVKTSSRAALSDIELSTTLTLLVKDLLGALYGSSDKTIGEPAVAKWDLLTAKDVQELLNRLDYRYNIHGVDLSKFSIRFKGMDSKGNVIIFLGSNLDSSTGYILKFNSDSGKLELLNNGNIRVLGNMGNNIMSDSVIKDIRYTDLSVFSSFRQKGVRQGYILNFATQDPDVGNIIWIDKDGSVMLEHIPGSIGNKTIVLFASRKQYAEFWKHQSENSADVQSWSTLFNFLTSYGTNPKNSKLVFDKHKVLLGKPRQLLNKFLSSYGIDVEKRSIRIGSKGQLLLVTPDGIEKPIYINGFQLERIIPTELSALYVNNGNKVVSLNSQWSIVLSSTLNGEDRVVLHDQDGWDINILKDGLSAADYRGQNVEIMYDNLSRFPDLNKLVPVEGVHIDGALLVNSRAGEYAIPFTGNKLIHSLSAVRPFFDIQKVSGISYDLYSGSFFANIGSRWVRLSNFSPRLVDFMHVVTPASRNQVINTSLLTDYFGTRVLHGVYRELYTNKDYVVRLSSDTKKIIVFKHGVKWNEFSLATDDNGLPVILKDGGVVLKADRGGFWVVNKKGVTQMLLEPKFKNLMLKRELWQGDLVSVDGKVLYKNGMPVLIDKNVGIFSYFNGISYVPADSLRDLLNSGYTLENSYGLDNYIPKVVLTKESMSRIMSGVDSLLEADFSNSFYLVNRWAQSLPGTKFKPSFYIEGGKMQPGLVFLNDGKNVLLKYSSRGLIKDGNIYPVFRDSNGRAFIIFKDRLEQVSDNDMPRIMDISTVFQKAGLHFAMRNNAFMVDTISGLPILIKGKEAFVLKANGLQKVYSDFNLAYENRYVQSLEDYKQTYSNAASYMDGNLSGSVSRSFWGSIKNFLIDIYGGKVADRLLSLAIDLSSRIDDIVFQQSTLGDQMINYTLKHARAPLSDKVLQTLLVQEEWDKFYKGHSNLTWKIVLNIIRSGGHRGGSTLVQQIVKSFMPDIFRGRGLSKSKLIHRKLLELVLAERLNKKLPADVIIRAAANLITFGSVNGVPIRGVEQAAWIFFGKPLTDLSYAESSLLVATINAPYKNGLLSLLKSNSQQNFRAIASMANGDLFKLYQRGIINEREYKESVVEVYEHLYGKPLDEYSYVQDMGVMQDSQLRSLYNEYLRTQRVTRKTITRGNRLQRFFGLGKTIVAYNYIDFLTFLKNRALISQNLIESYYSRRAGQLRDSYLNRSREVLGNNNGKDVYVIAQGYYRQDLYNWVDTHIVDAKEFWDTFDYYKQKYQQMSGHNIDTYDDLRSFLVWLSQQDSNKATDLSRRLYSFVGTVMVRQQGDELKLDVYPSILELDKDKYVYEDEKGVGINDPSILKFNINGDFGIVQSHAGQYHVSVVIKEPINTPTVVMKTSDGQLHFVKPISEVGENIFLDIKDNRVFKRAGRNLVHIGWYISLDHGGIIIDKNNLFAGVDLDKVLDIRSSIESQHDISLRESFINQQLLHNFTTNTQLRDYVFIPLSEFIPKNREGNFDLVLSSKKTLQSAFRVVGVVKVKGEDKYVVQYIGNGHLSLVSKSWLSQAVKESTLLAFNLRGSLPHNVKAVGQQQVNRFLHEVALKREIQGNGLNFFFVDKNYSTQSQTLQTAVDSFFKQNNAYVAFGSGEKSIALLAASKNTDQMITPGSIAKVFTEAVATSVGLKWAPGGREGRVCIGNVCVKVHNWTEQEYVSDEARRVLEKKSLSPAEVLAYSNNVGAAWDWVHALKLLSKSGIDVSNLFSSSKSKFSFATGLMGDAIRTSPNPGTVPELVFEGFGQGSFKLNNFAILAMMATIANHGKSLPIYMDSMGVAKITESFSLGDYAYRELHKGLQMAVSAKHGTATYAVRNIPTKLNNVLTQSNSPWRVVDFFGKTATAEIGGDRYNKGFAGALVFENRNTGDHLIVPFSLYQLGVEAGTPHTPLLFRDFVDKKLIPLIKQDPDLNFLVAKKYNGLQEGEQVASINNENAEPKEKPTYTESTGDVSPEREVGSIVKGELKITDVPKVSSLLGPNVRSWYSSIPSSQKLQCVSGVVVGPWLLPPDVKSKFIDKASGWVNDVKYLASNMGKSASSLISRIVGRKKDYNIVGQFGISGMSLVYLKTDEGYNRFMNGIEFKPVVGVRDRAPGDKWGHTFLIESYDKDHIIFIDMNRTGTGYKSDNTVRYEIVPKADKQKVINTILEFSGTTDINKVWLFIHGEYPNQIAFNR